MIKVGGLSPSGGSNAVVKDRRARIGYIPDERECADVLGWRAPPGGGREAILPSGSINTEPIYIHISFFSPFFKKNKKNRKKQKKNKKKMKNLGGLALETASSGDLAPYKKKSSKNMPWRRLFGPKQNFENFQNFRFPAAVVYIYGLRKHQDLQKRHQPAGTRG